MLFPSKKYIGVYLFILIMSGCANTGKMNFENNWNHYVATGNPSTEKLVAVRIGENNYLGKNIIYKNDIKIERYHFKLKGHPQWEACYYYCDVDYKTQRLIGWGYDEGGDERACVN